jgi:hypothetical protein
LNNGIRIALVALWFLAAVLPLLLFVISFYTEAELTRFLKEGVEGVGVVYDKHSRSGKSRSYYLDFRYEVEGKTYTGSTSVNRERYESSVTGEKLVLTILPSEPEKHRVGRVKEGDPESAKHTAWLIAGIIFAVFGGLASILTRFWFRKRSLLRIGQLREAVVKGFKTRAKGATVRYEFKFRPGESKVSTCHFNSWSGPELQVGETLPVLQDEGNPTHYDLLRRIASMVRLKK